MYKLFFFIAKKPNNNIKTIFKFIIVLPIMKEKGKSTKNKLNK